MPEIKRLTLLQLLEQWQEDQAFLIAQSLEYHKQGDSELAFHTDGRVIELTNCIIELNAVLKEKV